MTSETTMLCQRVWEREEADDRTREHEPRCPKQCHSGRIKTRQVSQETLSTRLLLKTFFHKSSYLWSLYLIKLLWQKNQYCFLANQFNLCFKKKKVEYLLYSHQRVKECPRYKDDQEVSCPDSDCKIIGETEKQIIRVSERL